MRGRINKEKKGRRGKGKRARKMVTKGEQVGQRGTRKRKVEGKGRGGNRKIKGMHRENEDGWIRDEMERGGRI